MGSEGCLHLAGMLVELSGRTEIYSSSHAKSWEVLDFFKAFMTHDPRRTQIQLPHLLNPICPVLQNENSKMSC